MQPFLRLQGRKEAKRLVVYTIPLPLYWNSSANKSNIGTLNLTRIADSSPLIYSNYLGSFLNTLLAANATPNSLLLSFSTGVFPSWCEQIRSFSRMRRCKFTEVRSPCQLLFYIGITHFRLQGTFLFSA